jgi:hypothetical protein
MGTYVGPGVPGEQGKRASELPSVRLLTHTLDLFQGRKKLRVEFGWGTIFSLLAFCPNQGRVAQSKRYLTSELNNAPGPCLYDLSITRCIYLTSRIQEVRFVKEVEKLKS